MSSNIGVLHSSVTSVRRGTTSLYSMPIEGRDEWLAAAARHRA